MAINKKLPKSRIPSQVDQPINADLEKYLNDFENMTLIGMANFYAGNGNINDPNQFKGKYKRNASRSVLGANNSIYTLLQAINVEVALVRRQLKTVDNKLEKISQAPILGNDISFISNNQTIESKEDNKKNNDEIFLDFQKTTLGIINSINDSNQKIFKDFSEFIKDKLITNKNLEDMTRMAEELVKINKTLHEEEISKIQEAKLSIIIEGLNNATIDQLIEFSKIDLSGLDQNKQYLISFLEALKLSNQVNIEETLGSLKDLDNILLTLGSSIHNINFSADLLNSNRDITLISDVLIKLNYIIESLNKLKPLKVNSDVLNNSIQGVLEIFIKGGSALAIIGPEVLLWNKLFGKINYNKFFEDLSSLFDKVEDTAFDCLNISDVENIIESISDIKNIMKDIISLGILNYTATKITKFDSITNTFGSIDEVFGYIKLMENIREGKRNLVHIKESITLLYDVFSNMVKMKLGSLSAKLLNIISINKVLEQIDSIFSNLDKNNSSYYQDTQIKLEAINKTIGIMNNVMAELLKMKLIAKISKIGSLEKINDFFTADENSIKSLMESISKNIGINKDTQKNLDTVNTSLLSIVVIINSLSQISKKKINEKKLKSNLELFITLLDETYKKINEKFNDVIQTANLVERVKNANQLINEGLDDCTKTAIDTSNKEKDIKQAQISIEGLTELMIASTVCMSIGALFVALGGGKFIKNALEFGIVLMAFETLVIAPALMFNGISKDAAKGISELSSFVITSTFCMSIGALFVALGNGSFIKNALVYGILLGIFEGIVVAPFLLFTKNQGHAFKGLEEFSKFLITTTILMSVGALFVALSNGKFVKNALMFGVALAGFELLVVTPFLLFGLIRKSVLENASSLNTVLITSTIIMMVGALFMMAKNGKLYESSIKFAKGLMQFEVMVIAPFLIMDLFKNKVFEGMHTFNSVIITSTIIMMVGALFVNAGNGKYIKAAMVFTGMLALFEIGVIAPFILFNKIQANIRDGALSFGLIVITATTTMLIGALFMNMNNGQMVLDALKFTGVLAAFEVGVLGPMWLFQKLGGKAIEGAEKFAIFIMLCTTSLLVGSLFIKHYGVDPVWQYAAILSSFVFVNLLVANFLTKGIDSQVIEKTIMFGSFIFLSTLSLVIGALFIEKFGIRSVLIYGSILTIFTAAIIGVTKIIKNGMDVKAIASMTAMGTFLLLATGSMILGAWFIEKYGWESVAIYGVCLAGFVVAMGLVFTALGFLSPLLIPGTIAAVALGVALMALTSSLMIVNALFELDKNGENLKKNLGLLYDVIEGDDRSINELFESMGGLIDTPVLLLGSVAAAAIGTSLLILGSSLALINLLMESGNAEKLQTNIELLMGILFWDNGLKDIYWKLGWMSPIIALGSVSILAISASMLLLSGSFELINLLMGQHGNDTKNNILILGEVLDSLKWTYTKLGALSILIIPGAIAATAIGTSMLMLGAAFRVIDDIKIDHLDEQLAMITSTLLVIGTIALALGALKIPLGMALVGVGMLNLFTFGITNSILTLNQGLEEITRTGNLKDNIQTAIDNMKAFLKMPAAIFEDTNVFEVLKLIEDINLLNNFIVGPMSKVMLNSAKAVESIAELKVPTSWDKDGNIKDYRQLTTQDFTDATTNTSTLLTTMANAFVVAYKGDNEHSGLKELIENEDNPINKIVQFGIESGNIISGVAESVGAMAKMQIPIAWDKNGKPIGYRQLAEQDFINASKGVEILLTNMANAISLVYSQGDMIGQQLGINKNIFDLFDDENPEKNALTNVLTFSLKVGQVIGNVGEAVAKIAALQIPIDWDPKTGKARRYRTLSPDDFNKMGIGIKTILTSIITEIGNLYKDGQQGDKNIFDMDGNWLTGDKPGPFERVLGFTFKVSEVMSKIAIGIKDLSNLKIPSKIAPDGTIQEYKTLTDTDFTNLGTSVGTILTAMTNAISSVEISDPNVLRRNIEAMQPYGEFLGNISEGIVKLASGSIPTKYNKDGKPIEFISLAKEGLYDDLAGTIKTILTSIGEGISQVYDENEEGLFKNEKMKEIMESICGMTTIVSNVADTAIKLSQALVADQWDKEGKPIHFKHIPLDSLQKDITIVLGSILTSTSEAVIDIYDKKGLKQIVQDKNSNFMQAISGINEMTSIVASIVDTVIKLGQAQIPVYKNGKLDHYDKVNINSTLKNIYKILNGDEKTDGMLNVLCNTINTVYSTYFANESKIEEKTQAISRVISNITETISGATKVIVDIASQSIPTKFGNDGKPTAYTKFGTETVENAQETINSIFKSFYTIFTGEEINNLTSNAKTIKQQSELLQQVIISEFDALDMMMTNISDINDASSDVDKFLKLDLKGILNKIGDNVNLFASIYDNPTLKEIFKDNIMNSIVQRMAMDIFTFTMLATTPFDDLQVERANKLDESIKKLSETMSKPVSTQKFQTNTVSLQKYIKTINTVDVKKVSDMTKLIQEINKLNNGNLDALTKSIVEQLTPVLQHLVERLEESKDVINQADHIQKERHKQINTAIRQIKDIMANPIAVKVSSDTTEEDDDNSTNTESTQSNATVKVNKSEGSNNGESKEQPQQPQQPIPSRTSQPKRKR